jgi:hypothetical protein
VALLITNFTRLGTRSETCNILVLRCLGHVERNRVVIVTCKPIMKLGFGFSIMP